MTAFRAFPLWVVGCGVVLSWSASCTCDAQRGAPTASTTAETATTNRERRSTPRAGGGAAVATSTDRATPGANVVRAPLPEPVLEALLGCWLLEGRERWIIARTPKGGAQLVRTVQMHDNWPLDYPKRAAAPSDVMYDPEDGTLAVATAGRTHALLFVFKTSVEGLEGDWASSGAPGQSYRWTGSHSTLIRCNASKSGEDVHQGEAERGPPEMPLP